MAYRAIPLTAVLLAVIWTLSHGSSAATIQNLKTCPAGELPKCTISVEYKTIVEKYAHPYNCDWYFLCSNGVPYCLQCEEGTIYNPETERCDNTVRIGCVVETTPAPTTPSPPTTPAPTTQPPPTPAPTTPALTTQPPPPTVPPTTPAPTTQPPPTPAPTTPALTTQPPAPTLPPATSAPTISPIQTTICPAAVAPACPAQDPRMAVLLAHPTSCEWYFECSNGIPYCMPCPAGEHFNPKLKVCDYPEHAGCGTGDVIPNINVEPPKADIPEPPTGNDKPSTTIQHPHPHPPPNNVKNICPAAEAPACPAQDPRMAVLLAHPTSCEWYFECSNGIPYCMPCPAGEHFNPKLKVCDYPEHAGCGTGDVIPNINVEPPKEDIPEPPTGNDKPSTTIQHPHPHPPPNNVKNICPAAEAPACPAQDPRMAVLQAHPTSCEWYFECSNGIPYCMPCPAGEHFNPKLKVCDYPEHAGCGTGDVIPNINVEPPKEDIPEPPTGNDKPSTTIQHPHPPPNNVKNICPAAEAPACPAQDPRMAVLLAHPTSCEWYFECSNGIPYCMPCPAGEYFNPKLKVCDYPEHAGCGTGDVIPNIIVEPPKEYIPEPSSGNDKPSTTILRPHSHPTPNNVKNVCPAAEAPACPAQDPRMAVLLAHPTSCEWYFECSNGIPYCMPCPAGEYFNSKLKVCDYPEHAGCGTGDVIPNINIEPPKEDIPEPPTGNDKPSTTIQHPHPHPPPNNVKNICPAAEAPACPAQDPRMAVLLAHPTSCEWYFECSNGIPYCMPCPAGEHFNSKLKVCDYPEHAGCGTGDVIPNINVEPPKEDIPEPPTGNDKPSTTIQHPHPPPNNVKNICPAAEAPACPALDPRMAVLQAHPTSCEWYFECSNGIPYCMPCPAGEHFNPKLKVCDYPEHAGCGTGDVIPNINVEPPKEDIPEPPTGNDKPSTTIQHPHPPQNNVKNICPAAEAPACPAQDPRMAVLLAHPTSCEWYFECSNGIPYCMPCPAGEYFNPKLKVCDYPEHAGCGTGDVIPNIIVEPPKEYIPEPSSGNDKPSTTILRPHSHPTPNNVKNVCPAAEAPACPAQDPRMAVLLAHPTSCEWYFECSNGIPYCMPCPAGEYFNSKLKVCDYPEHAGCGTGDVIPNINIEPPKEDIPEPPTGNDKPSTTIQHPHPHPPPNNVKNICPAAEAPACPAQDPRMAVLLAHPTSCEWYFECSNGIPYCMPCPAGEHFNSKLKVCDYPEHAGCGTGDVIPNIIVEPPKEYIPEPSSGNDKPSTTILHPHPHSTPNNVKNVCPAAEAPACPAQDPRMAVLLAHPTSCEWYFECSNGIPYCMPCPAGEYFNPKLKVCDYPEHAGCGTGDVIPNIIVEPPKEYIPEPSSGNDKPSTTILRPHSHPTPNNVKNVCPAAEAPACPAQDPRMAVLLAHPTSCEWYFECSNGIPYCMPCPAGEYFNSKLKVCDYPEHAGCGTGDVIPNINVEPPIEHIPEPSGNDEPSTSILHPHPHPTPNNVKNVCPAAEAPACPAQDPRMAVLLAHPTSCEWYFECSNGISYCMPCPVGEYFNPILKVCDYPDKAGCTIGSVIDTITVTGTGKGPGTSSVTETRIGTGPIIGTETGTNKGTRDGNVVENDNEDLSESEDDIESDSESESDDESESVDDDDTGDENDEDTDEEDDSSDDENDDSTDDENGVGLEK